MAVSDVTLTQEQFATLVTLARRNILSAEDLRRLDSFLATIYKKNNIQHYLLWVRWQNAGELLPVTVNWPREWPPKLEYCLESFERPISKKDVQDMLDRQGKEAINISVTTDPAKLVGWSNFDDYFSR